MISFVQTGVSKAAAHAPATATSDSPDPSLGFGFVLISARSRMGPHEYGPRNPFRVTARRFQELVRTWFSTNNMLATGLRLDTTFGFGELLGFLSCGINQSLHMLRQTSW